MSFGVYLSFGCEKFMGRSFFFFDPILRNFAALFSLLQFSLLSLDAQHDFSDTPMPQSELLRTLSQFFPCQFPLVHFLVFGRSQSLSFSNLECLFLGLNRKNYSILQLKAHLHQEDNSTFKHFIFLILLFFFYSRSLTVLIPKKFKCHFGMMNARMCQNP